MHELAVIAIGADRPGIVATVAEVLRDRGGNLEDSAMTILGGHFSMMLLVATEDDAETLHRELSEATAELGLTVSVSPVGEGHAGAEPTHVLSVYGADRPGLLAGVSRSLADAGVNITDVETRLLSPGGDAPVYAMLLELVLPEGMTEQALEQQLADVSRELAVDHTLRTLETETY